MVKQFMHMSLKDISDSVFAINFLLNFFLAEIEQKITLK